MKILHTGDWHIGKLIHGVHMTEDQKYILKQLLKLIKEEKPDVLLITGDIYDRSIPPIEAVELLDEVLSEILLKQKVKVIAIAGNHDSPDRVGFASRILKENGLYISGNLPDEIKPVIIEDDYGPVHFYPIPYVEPVIVKGQYDDETIRTHDNAMNSILERIDKHFDKSVRNVCLAHGFITGVDKLDTSESERPLCIGGSEYVSVDYFEKFNYVALGHLHRAQKVKHDYIRYAGSLMKYSFSEANQNKSVTIVNMDAKGNIELNFKILKPMRDLRIIKGQLEKLIDKEIYSQGNTTDYIMAILTDSGELIDPIGTLRAVYPNILRLENQQFDRKTGENKTAAGSDFVKKNPLNLFQEFYENMSGEDFTIEKSKTLEEILDEMNLKRRIS